MDKVTTELLLRIDNLLSRFSRIKAGWHSSAYASGFNDTVGYEALVTEVISIITHIYGNGHPHTQRVLHAFNSGSLYSLQQMEGILEGTKSNLAAGLLSQLKTKILLDIKSDFLDMAQQLMDDGAKDPAAVLSCTVLEDSLKRLSALHGVEGAETKDMSIVSAMLLKKGVIEKSTNKVIGSFKELRNAAFHAQWDQVSEEAVRTLLTFLPAFIEKHGI